MNADQHGLMKIEANRNLPNLKYHNERGMLGLRYQIDALQEVFAILKAEGDLPTDEENVRHLIYSITSEKVSTGNVSHIVTRPALLG